MIYCQTSSSLSFFKLDTDQKMYTEVSTSPIQTRLMIIRDENLYNFISQSFSNNSLLESTEIIFNQKVTEVKVLF